MTFKELYVETIRYRRLAISYLIGNNQELVEHVQFVMLRNIMYAPLTTQQIIYLVNRMYSFTIYKGNVREGRRYINEKAFKSQIRHKNYLLYN